ncbi:ATP-grasp domain-containing protein [Nocardia gamkensis]|uniref:ATP-grasp domain-containing protein n=1 Tax=Nocardia gamkensis TaxID=352869 RepID=UPI0033EA4234
MARSHVLVVGTALAADFARAHPEVRTSVLCHKPAEPTSPGIFLREIHVERNSAPTTWRDSAREVDEACPVDRVVAFGENEQIIAAIIAADLELDGHHSVDVARIVADKIEMRKRLSATGLGTVEFAEAADHRAIELFAHGQSQNRYLVKPAMGTGSRGVSELVDLRQCAAAFNRAHDVAHPIAGTQRVMVEQFKPGRQLSVECISEAGEHRPVAITQKYTDERTFAEVGHCVPADLSTAEADAVVAGTVAALRALGVRYGPTHTELVLGKAGRVDLIETHTRLGGHGIPDLVADAIGIDMYDLTFAQAAGASVISRVPEVLPRAGSSRAVWFGYSPVRGRVRSVRSAAQSEAQVEVLVNRGDLVTADMTRSSRVVAARASGPTEADATRKASQAVSEVTLTIECSMTAQLLGY